MIPERSYELYRILRDHSLPSVQRQLVWARLLLERRDVERGLCRLFEIQLARAREQHEAECEAFDDYVRARVGEQSRLLLTKIKGFEDWLVRHVPAIVFGGPCRGFVEECRRIGEAPEAVVKIFALQDWMPENRWRAYLGR